MGAFRSRKLSSISSKVGVVVLVLVLAIIGVVLLWEPGSRLPKERATPLPLEEEQVIHLEPRITAEQTPAPMYILDGSVLDETGQGYASARLSVKSADDTETTERRVTTDSFGRFRCQLPRGRFVFSATAADAIAAVTREHATDSDAESSPILRLPRAHIVSGEVIDTSSNPIPGAHIALYANRNFDTVTVTAAEPMIAAVSYAAVADASGAFQFPTIWPGTYSLEAGAESYLGHTEATIPAGVQDKKIVLRREASLLVRVLDDTNAPVFLAAVQLRRDDGAGVRIETEETPQSGEVHFLSLSPGGYEISAKHTDYALTDRSTAQIKVDRDFHDATLVLKHKGYSVSGHVLDVETRGPVAEFPLALLPPSWSGYNVIRGATSGAEGFFSFDDVPRGKYRIGKIFEAEKAHPYTLLSGRKAVIPVTVEDADVEGIEILAYKGPQVTGHVYDRQGKPVRQAYVQMTRGWTLTDEDGEYRAYLHLYARRSSSGRKERLYASHPEHGSGESAIFTYQPGETIEGIDIVLDQSVKIVGQVTDKAGEPIPEAEVEYRIFAHAVYKRILHLDGRTVLPVDSHGRFEIPNAPLMPGDDVRLTVKAPGYQTETRRRAYYAGHVTREQKMQNLDDNPVYVWVKGKKAVTENFELTGEGEEKEKTLQIRGIVVDRNGAPMGKINVVCRSMEKDIRRPPGTTGIETESDGSFVCENLQEETRYYLVARMKKPPYLEKEAFPIPAGAEDVVIRLDFEPVELTVQIDDSRLKPDHDRLIFKITLMSIGQPDLPAIRELGEKNVGDPAMAEKSFTLKSPGEYQIHVQGGGGDNRERLLIDTDTPKELTIRVLPEPISQEAAYLVLGRCVDTNGEPTSEQYRARVRRLDASDSPPFDLEARSYNNTKMGSYFSIVLDQDGLFVVLYLRMDGTVFHRTVVPLSRSQAMPWEGEEKARVIVLPEVIYPADNSS